MGKIEYFKINLERSDHQTTYFPGESLRGTLDFRVLERFKINSIRMIINGSGRVSWTERNGKNYKTYSAKQTYVNHKIVFMEKPDERNSADMYLEVQEYSFPFSYVLPTNLPTSFEHNFGRIRYTITAIIDIPWSTNKTSSRLFTVINNLDLNEMPNLRQAVEKNDSKTLCCGPCRSGPIFAEFTLKKTGFVPGETIICHASVDNGSRNEIGSMTVTLYQEICFRGVYYSYEKKKRIQRSVIAKRYSNSIMPHSHQDWNEIKLLIPPICSSTVGLHGSRLIEVNYALVFNFNPSGVHTSKDILVPIVIGTKPLIDNTNENSMIAPPPPYSYKQSVFEPTEEEELPPDYDKVKGEVLESDSKHFRPHYLYFYSLST